MCSYFGREVRLSKIFDEKTGKALVVALDHGLFLGPIQGLTKPQETLEKVVAGGADAVILTPGQMRHCLPNFLGKKAPSLILRLDWTNLFRDVLRPEFGFETTIASVKDAIRYGADAVISFLFIGYEKDEVEALNLRNVSKIARECEKYGVPLIIESMARGGKARGKELNIEYVKLHVRMAAELGADLIKTDYTGDPESFKEVVESCNIPILIAGGPKLETPHDALKMAKEAVDAGARGVVFGRNVFQAPDVTNMVKALRLIVHEGAKLKEALRLLETKSIGH
jgi:class I fructose-bisphosphate aldolase